MVLHFCLENSALDRLCIPDHGPVKAQHVKNVKATDKTLIVLSPLVEDPAIWHDNSSASKCRNGAVGRIPDQLGRPCRDYIL